MIVGPDGFLCTRDDPRSACYALLNEILRELAKDPSHAHEVAGAAVKRLKKALSAEQLVELALAAFDRAAWIEAHHEELAGSDAWKRRLATVLYHLYALRLPFAVPEMCRLMGGRSGTAPPVGRVSDYFASRELTPEACSALWQLREAYKARIGRDYKHVDVQTELQLLDMLLWHDERDPLELGACWSERVRRDHRAMSGDRRRRWQALLRHIRGDAGSKPPKVWIKEAQSRLAAVGAEDFRATVIGWFACFRQPDPLRLSVVGSHVLKGLLWYCALAGDPAVTEAALPLLDAEWKPKRNLDKVMVALALVIDTMPVEQAWAALLPLQKAWGVSQGRIEQLAIKIARSAGISEEQLRAQGVLKPLQPLPSSTPPEQLAARRQAVEELFAALKNLFPRAR